MKPTPRPRPTRPKVEHAAVRARSPGSRPCPPSRSPPTTPDAGGWPPAKSIGPPAAQPRDAGSGGAGAWRPRSAPRWTARAVSQRSRARPSSEPWSTTLRTAATKSAGVLGDLEQVVVEPALGERRGDDRPAGRHVVHDLGRAGDPVERVVGPVGDQADVERGVVAADLVLRPPAEPVDVGQGDGAPVGAIPGLAGAGLRLAADQDDRALGERAARGVRAGPSRSGLPGCRRTRAAGGAGGRCRPGARRRAGLGRRGDRRRRGAVRQVDDPVGRLGDRRAQLLGAEPGEKTDRSASRTARRSRRWTESRRDAQYRP